MPVYNSVLIDSFNKVIENILKIKGKFLIFSFLTSSHLYVSVVRSVRQSVGPSLGVQALSHVPEHDVAIIIPSHQSVHSESLLIFITNSKTHEEAKSQNGISCIEKVQIN